MVYGSEGNQSRITSAGAVEAVVAALQEHAENPYVQEHACGALWNFVLGDPNVVQRARALGAVEAIERTIEVYVANDAVQECACGALSHLAPERQAKGQVKQGMSEREAQIMKAWQRRVDIARQRTSEGIGGGSSSLGAAGSSRAFAT